MTRDSVLSSGQDSSRFLSQMYNLPLSDYGPDEVLANDETPSLLNDFNIKLLLKFCTVISAISVALNTPATFQSAEVIRYICLALDIFSGLVFLAEMIIKVRRDGFFKGDSAYFKKFWCIFDFIMLLCIWLTVIVEVLELPEVGLIDDYDWINVLYAPRALLPIKIVRSFLKYSLPKTNMNSIYRHSGQQIVTVSVFYLFFISLYSFVGVQLFGDLQQHCVDKTAVELRVNVTELPKYLAIPDTLCSNFSDSGYQCPNDMVCIDLQYFDIQRTELGFVGFDNFLLGLLSVYQSSSLEGWVYTMYKTMDSYVSWYAYIYFLTMVFFVAWLIKNVFIAVITEAFAEMRSQLQEMWGNIALPANFSTKTLQETSGKWHLVTSEISYYRKNGEGITKVLHLRAFHATIIVCIIFDAAILASKFAHMPEDYANFIWYSQIAFTLLFNIEAIFKMYCYGIRSYLFRFAHIYELILAVGSSVYILIAIAIGQDSNLATKLTVFAVLRILRIVRILPMLQDFMFRILGNGKKIGLLLAFTICFLLIVSLLSLQLFSRVEKLKLFETYPAAVGSTFQVLLQEGWPDVMNDALLANTIDLSPLVAIYFTMLHLFASSILFSIFIAVILDSLDLDEEVKKYRQGKMHEESVVTEEKLPYRIRVYEKFREKPRMATIKKSTITSNFEIPKMRESFLKQYVNECTDDNSVNDTMPAEEEDNTAILHRRATARKVQLRRTITEDVTACNPADEQFQRSPNMLSPIPRCNTIDSQYLTRSRRSSEVAMARRRARLTKLIEMTQTGKPVMTTPEGVLSPRIRRQHSVKHPFAHRRSIRASLISKGNVINKADLDTLKHIARRNKEKSDNLENEAPSDWVDVNAIIEKKQQAKIKRRAMEENLRENHPFFDTSLFLLSPNSHLRKLCQRIAHAKYNPPRIKTSNIKTQLLEFAHNILASFTYLNWFIIIVNISSCLIMAWETPHGPDVGLNFTQIADIIFIAVTSLELIIKIIADGLIFTPAALMRNFSGFLDIFVYFVSVLSYLYHAFNLSVNSGAEFLAVLRCLRPLRVITLVPKMSQVVSELVRGFKEILLVSLMLLMLLFTFANYGVQMFAGKLARCNKGFGIPQENCSGTFSIPLQVTTQVVGLRESKSTTLFVPEVWKVSPAGYSFDNIGKAMLTLFEVITLEGWTSMRSILQSMKQDFGIIYIHVFVFVGFMIGLTLFVGVVMTNFNENKGTALLTVDQRRWLDLKGRLKIAQPLHIPPRPDSTNRGQIYDIIESKYYRIFSIIIITSNCLMLYVKWSKDNEYLPDPSNFILAANLFIGWYWIEFFLRVIAYSFAGYFESYRNRYDFALILIGTAWLVLSVIFTAENEIQYLNNLGIMTIILKFFTVTWKHDMLKMLFITVSVSVRKSFFGLSTLMMVLMCYALAGVVLFGNVKWGEGINRHTNFESAGQAMLVLTRIMTGEDWYKIMNNCMITTPYCTTTLENGRRISDCGNYAAAIIYFISFYVIVSFMFVNLFIAIVVENFSLFYSDEEESLLSQKNLYNFQTTWNLIDRNRKGTIPVRHVKFLLALLKGRLALDSSSDRLLFKYMCCELEKRHDGKDVSFRDVLSMLAYRSVDITKCLQLKELIEREELEYAIEEDVAKQIIKSWFVNCIMKKRKNEARARTDTGLHIPQSTETVRLNRIDITTEVAGLSSSSDDNDSLSGKQSLENTDEDEKENLNTIRLEKVYFSPRVNRIKFGRHRNLMQRSSSEQEAASSRKYPLNKSATDSISSFRRRPLNRQRSLEMSASKESTDEKLNMNDKFDVNKWWNDQLQYDSDT